MKHRVVVLGAGKIGCTIAPWLAAAGDFDVCVADVSESSLQLAQDAGHAAGCTLEVRRLDATDPAQLGQLFAGRDSVLSALTYHQNPIVAEAALLAGVSYFDLTEDVATTRMARSLAERARAGQVFAPQCGLAPGFVSVATCALTKGFERLERVSMRVGALPQFPTNTLKYNLTWSTDGLVNEYCNPCEAIVEGQRREVLPLEGLEQLAIGGVGYEAFNTSGGLGTLCETLDGSVRELNYKSIRYPGHREYAHFLVNDLRLRERRELFRELLENAVPVTQQDVVIVLCSASGWREGRLEQITDCRKIYNQNLLGREMTAIQVATASGVCAFVDLHRVGALGEGGFVRQESVSLANFLDNRFGAYYRAESGKVEVGL